MVEEESPDDFLSNLLLICEALKLESYSCIGEELVETGVVDVVGLAEILVEVLDVAPEVLG